MTALWPADYGVADDHCGDVLRGSYEVPWNPDEAPIILDIGANVGAFAVWAANRWPGCKLHCYEPHPKNFELLQRTIIQAKIHALPHNCAIGAKPGAAKLYESPNNCGEHSLKHNFGSGAVAVQVNPPSTLPEADILKIDTEGCEGEILQGLDELGRLAKFSCVMMETHRLELRDAIVTLLTGRGFALCNENKWSEHRSELAFMRQDLLDKRPIVWVATPLKQFDAGEITEENYKKLPEHYRASIGAFSTLCNQNKLPWRFNLFISSGGSVFHGRAYIVSRFLDSDAEYLFFRDLDLIDDPTGRDFIEILYKMYMHKVDICGGLYTTREDGPHCHWILNGCDVAGPLGGWALRVMELGTGYKCFRRRVFTTIGERYPWMKCEHDETHLAEWAFFSAGAIRDDKYFPDKNRFLTEDYWFDHYCRKENFVIVAHVGVKLKHEDNGKIYPKEFPPLPVAEGPFVTTEEKS